jgi:hypothetical protein
VTDNVFTRPDYLIESDSAIRPSIRFCVTRPRTTARIIIGRSLAETR